MTDAIVWDENDTPVATRFDDPYYSKRDGRAETRHVFLNGNRLVERWQEAETFHVAELGFGTGLNFLETVSNWQEMKGSAGSLYFTSFEMFPLKFADISRALKKWPDLLGLVKPYISVLDKGEGWHEVTHENVTLRLAIGDANILIRDMVAKADAWYLDGFSPAKNPELWMNELMKEVAARTEKCGTFATYTSAGWVRRMMYDAGFDVSRTKGFGTKRHMSTGVLR